MTTNHAKHPRRIGRLAQAGGNAGLLIAASVASCCMVEAGVRQLFPDASDDEAFWERMTDHVLNSPVVVPKAAGNHHDEFGFVLDSNQETHVVSDEFSWIFNTNDQGLRTTELTPGGGGGWYSSAIRCSSASAQPRSRPSKPR